MSEVINLYEKIEFPKQGILSKTISEHPSGEVDVFFMPKGEKLSKHTASRDASVFILKGEVDFQLGEDWHHLKEGDWFFMPSGMVHQLAATEDLVFMLTLFGS